MGQSSSTESARQDEIIPQLSEATLRVVALLKEADAEKAAGVPPAPGSKQALLQAAWQHQTQLANEYCTVADRKSGCRC